MKKIGAALLGGFLVLVGIALLVLPGPGFLLIAAGLVILASQFEWAEKYLDYAKGKAQQGVDEVAKSWWRALFALVCALALVAAGVLAIAGVDLPFVNTLSAVLLVVGGLFLVGTVVYARKKGSGPGNNAGKNSSLVG